MGPNRFLGFMFVMMVVMMGLLSSLSQAVKFDVGGKDGWVLKPSEDYNHWAESNRFQVNDTLFFKYKKGSDSILVVTKYDYYSCNTKNPIQTLNDGDSTFKFDRSGPFFFISGNGDNCQKGQRVTIVVLAARDKPHRPPPSSPTPVASPPAVVPSPKAESPKVASPQPSRSPLNRDLDAPAPAPSGNSATTELSGGSFGLALCISIGVISVWFWVAV
ncbi:Early nodulin-like protein [Quillaja saponaria]|uniref:Early nodulin-like protein n=1 Tax=Quillaja saponaria TaxID=32244 RepID=A0AAD7L031_QUISA|nr:Early nodulin-like protein [Quillaja saponaria]